MKWKVVYTDDALMDLQGIYEYIAFTLLEPVTAERQSESIMDAADSLEDMPLRHRLYDKEPWRSRGIHFLPVDNYLVFYLPNEANNAVAIIRIMYGGRDVEGQLGKTFI
jgi:toxin ParE1/3/4